MKSGQVAELYNKFALSADRCAGLRGWVRRRLSVFCRVACLLAAANFGAQASVETGSWTPVGPVARVAEPSRILAARPLSGGKPSIINGISVLGQAVGSPQILAQTGGKETGGKETGGKETGGTGPVVPPVKREQPATPPVQDAKPPVPAQPAQPVQPAQAPQAPVKKPEQALPAQPPPQPAKTATPAPAGGGPFEAVQDWLARSNREYQGVLMKQLSHPSGGPAAPDAIAKKLEELKPDDAKKLEDDKKKAAEAKRLADEERRRAEALLKTEEARKAEAQKLEAQKLEAQKLEAQKAEAQKAEAQKETQTKAEEAKRAEAAKKLEPAPPATQPKPDDGKAAEANRQAEEAKKAEAQKAKEALQLKEAERLADERRRQELTRIEDQKKQDATRLQDERRKAEQAAAQAAAEAQRKVQEAESAKHRSRAIVIVPEAIPRPKPDAQTGKAGTAKPETALETPPKEKRPKDTRLAEGSAETGPVDPDVTREARATAKRARGTDDGVTVRDRVRTWDWRPSRARAHKCRAAGRLVTPPAHYIVKRGDSLWRISARHYHKGRLYTLIYNANRHRISDPNLIYPCQSVLVPRRR